MYRFLVFCFSFNLEFRYNGNQILERYTRYIFFEAFATLQINI